MRRKKVDISEPGIGSVPIKARSEKGGRERERERRRGRGGKVFWERSFRERRWWWRASDVGDGLP